MGKKKVVLLLSLLLIPWLVTTQGEQPVHVGKHTQTELACFVKDGKTVVELTAGETIIDATLFLDKKRIEIPDVPGGWSITYEEDGEHTTAKLVYKDGSIEALCIK